MPSQYFPINVRTFVPKVNLQDTVNADDVNSLQTEVYNIEYYLNGTSSPQAGMLTSNWTGSFVQRGTAWPSLADRINNIEAGLVNGVTTGNSPYFKKSGDVVTVSNAVAIKTKNILATNGTNLIETYDYTNTLGFAVDGAGNPKVGANNVVYVNSTEYNALVASIQAAAEVANGNPFNPFMLAGM